MSHWPHDSETRTVTLPTKQPLDRDQLQREVNRLKGELQAAKEDARQASLRATQERIDIKRECDGYKAEMEEEFAKNQTLASEIDRLLGVIGEQNKDCLREASMALASERKIIALQERVIKLQDSLTEPDNVPTQIVWTVREDMRRWRAVLVLRELVTLHVMRQGLQPGVGDAVAMAEHDRRAEKAWRLADAIGFWPEDGAVRPSAPEHEWLTGTGHTYQDLIDMARSIDHGLVGHIQSAIEEYRR